MLMRFIGRLVAKMGCDLRLEVLMKVPDVTELQMLQALVSWPRATSRLLYGSWKSARGTRQHVATSWEPRGHVLMEAMRSGTRFIVTPTGGLKDIVEDGFADLWTDGKMTAEAPVEQQFSRQS